MSAETRDAEQLVCKPPQLVTKTPKVITYRTGDSWNLGSGSSPTGASMSNTARVQAILRNRVRRANHRPGHNLSTGVRERQELQPMQSRTVCPCRKRDPRDPSRSDPTSRPSRTVQDRTCAAQGIRSRHGILPCAFSVVS